MQETKTFLIKQPSMIVDMYDQLIQELTDQGSKTNRQQQFREWVIKDWLVHCAKHKIELDKHILFFLTEEAMQIAKALIADYQAKGLSIDKQIINIISERAPAYAVRKPATAPKGK